jgi:peptide-methionine (S)-S-oxide reductase
MRRALRLCAGAWVAILMLTACVVASDETAVSDSLHQSKEGMATAIFAGGCFWCVEEAFDKVEGVLDTTSGYTGGHVENPSYEQVSSGGTGHIEAVRVTFDPARVSYQRLLQIFWRNIDPLDDGGQFCDRGAQYRSAVFPVTPDQQRLAEASKQAVAAQLGGRPVATTIQPAQPFYVAEAYHQDYHRTNPVRYRFYKWNCGRAQRLQQVWGDATGR